MLPTCDRLRLKDKHTLKVKGWKKLFHENKFLKAGVAVLRQSRP